MASIVVADADTFACELIALQMERQGHEVIRAANGAAVIAAVTQRTPQLVLTEITLPMRSGYDILNAITALGLAPQLPVIFVTANATEREMSRALAAGVCDFVVKPFHPGELAMRVSLALARRAGDQRPEPLSRPPSRLAIAA